MLELKTMLKFYNRQALLIRLELFPKAMENTCWGRPRFRICSRNSLTDAERYRLLTSAGPGNVLLFDNIRKNRRKFLKSWLQNDRFSNWLVYTQLSGSGGLCKTCILMQVHLTHGSLANAAFLKRPRIDFKKFIEKALSHRDAAYHREATLAVKNFISSMESGKNIYA